MGPRVWMPVDAGIPPRPDAAAAPEQDGGVRVCLELGTLSEAQLPRCRSTTRDCVMGCPGEGGDECRDACWAADPTPRTGPPDDVGCNDCIFRQVIGCIDRGPCHAEVAAFFCCIVDQCATGGDSCIDEMCNAQAQAMFGCGIAETPECIDVIGGEAGMCYAAEDEPVEPDAGATEDGGAS